MISEIDIFDPDLYAKEVPHDRFELLRREAPVFWHKEPGGPGFWAVTKYRDVIDVSRDAATFSSEAKGVQIPDLPRDDARVSPEILANMDPPKHTQYRAIIGQSFTPRGLAQMEGFIAKRVNDLLDQLVPRKKFEFIEDFAAKLPMTTILNMVGVPSGDEAMLDDWIHKILALDEGEERISDEERAETTKRFMHYAHNLAAARRESSRDDLLSRLMAAEVDGVKLSYQEFGMFFMLLLAAGTHSTRIILGNGILALIEHEDQRARLRREPTLITSAVEEMLRYAPPIIHFRRTATRDTQIRGTNVAAGQKVVLWYVSANRDVDAFSEPHTFDIGRTPNEHVTFGYGPHFCIGNALARMSARIAISECIKRMPRMELDGRLERLRSNWFNGMKKMPVAVGRPS